MSILDYIEKIKRENEGPRITAQEPRNMELAKADIPRHLWTNMNIPDLEQSPDSFLQPGETLEDWDVSFRRPNADGGVQQLVAPSVDGSRPGYNGETYKKEILNAPKNGKINLKNLAEKYKVSRSTIAGYRDKNRPDLKSITPYKKNVKYSQGVVEPNITLTNAGTYEVATKGKHVGTFADIDDARDALADFKADNPDLYKKKPKLETRLFFTSTTSRNLYTDETLSKKIINLAEQGKSNEYILNKIGNPKKVSVAHISEVVNKLVEDGAIKEKYKRVKFSGIPQFELDKRNKIINDMIKKTPLPTAEAIAKKADTTTTTVTAYLRDTKGEEWVDKNYGKSRFLRYGDTPLKKQFLEYVNNNPVEKFNMKNILKNTDIKTKKEAHKIYKAMLSDVYQKRAPEVDRPALYIDEKINLKDLTAKLRGSDDFLDQFERGMDRLLLEAYDGKFDSKEYKKARKTLTAYRKLIQPLNKKYPSLAQVIEHPIPYTFLKEVKAGKDPLNLINTYILGDKENKFKSYLDQEKIKIRRGLVDNPKNEKLLTQLEDMEKLESLLSKETGMRFGKIKTKFTDPRVQDLDFDAQTFGKKKIVPQIKKSLEIREKTVDFFNKFKNDKTVQELFKKAGIGPKIFQMLGRLRKGNIKGFLKQMDEVLEENPGLRVQFEDEFKDIQNQYAALDTGTMTDAGMKIDFSMPPPKEAGLPSEVVSAGTLPVMKYGKKIMGGLGKGIAGIDLPLVQAAFALSDPTTLAYTLPFTKAAADVTGITKPAATKAGQVAKNVLSGIGPKRLAKYAGPVSRISTPFGIGMLGYDIAKHSKPNYYIDPQTQEPTFYDRENASDVLPTMMDIYDQAYNLSKKENISYQEALNKVNPERFYKLKND